MVIESTAPPITTDDEKPNAPLAVDKDGQNFEGDKLRENFIEHVYVNLEPMREELVQNAVKFLSHSSVRNSPVISRRSFLEKRGLTKEEIDEAFCRVPPDQPTNVTIGQSLTSNQDVRSKSLTNIQPQTTVQSMQHPPAIPPTGVISTKVTPRPSKFYWSHAFAVLGLLVASGAGTVILLKNFILPRMKSWIRKVVLEEHDGSANKSIPSLFKEVTAAAKTASTAAANAAKASMQILNSKTEERQYFEALMKRLDIQVAEMRSMSNSILKLEGTREAAPSSYKQPENNIQQAYRNGIYKTQRKSSVFDSKGPTSSPASAPKVRANDISNFDGSVRPSSAPASMGISVGQHPKSYMEIMAMIQRGETPPGIKEINDSPPNPAQAIPNPGMAPRIKPWEVARPYSNGTYARSLESTSQLNGDRVVPWWHQKKDRKTELEPTNGTRTNLSNAMTDKRLIHHSWVPTEAPSVATLESADAIRNSKPMVQEISVDEQLISTTTNGTNEFLRISKISELGGGMEIQKASSESPSNKVQEKDIVYEGN